MKNWLILPVIGLAACLRGGARDGSELTRGHPAAAGAEWYYTCSNDLLICCAGYGAVEWIAHPSCTPLKRIKCVRGAINP